MRKKQVEEIADGVIDWCATNHGHSKFYDGLPMVEVEYDGVKGVRAEFEAMNNLIIVYVRGNQSAKQVVMSVLHEYKHYLQSPSWLERYATIYRRKQYKNPYEIDAELFAEENWRRCTMDILQ